MGMGMILGIIHYAGAVFFCYSFGRAFFALVAVGMVVIMMNGKHICPHEMVFFLFPVIYIFCAANRFFFPSLPPKKVIRVKIATLCWLCCCCCRR